MQTAVYRKVASLEKPSRSRTCRTASAELLAQQGAHEVAALGAGVANDARLVRMLARLRHQGIRHSLARDSPRDDVESAHFVIVDHQRLHRNSLPPVDSDG